MADETKFCDGCGEQWEESFFCEICSKGGFYEMREVPNFMWNGDPSEEYIWQEEWVPDGDICLNCCMCHTKPSKPLPLVKM